MGYYTRITGEIAIDPPLTWREIKAWRARTDVDHSMLPLKLEQETVDMDEGPMTRTRGVAVGAYEESFRSYGFTEAVQCFAALFGKDRTFTGRFEARGEDNEDMWRLMIRDSRIITTKAWVVWPEDLDPLRTAWAKRPTGDDGTDAHQFDEVRKILTDFLDHAHREAAKSVD